MLSEQKEREHAPLPEVAQELVHLEDQKALVRHGVEIAIEAVDDDDPRAVHLNTAPHVCRELARRQFRRVDLLEADEAGVEVLL